MRQDEDTKPSAIVDSVQVTQAIESPAVQTICSSHDDNAVMVMPLIPVATLPSQHQQLEEADVSSAAALSVEQDDNNGSRATKMTENDRLTVKSDVNSAVKRPEINSGTFVQPGAMFIAGIDQENSERNTNLQQDHTVFPKHQHVDNQPLDTHDEQSQGSSTHSMVMSQHHDLNQSSSTRQQDDERSSFFVEAELVSPPIEAVSVVIDEEQLHSVNTALHLESSLQSSDGSSLWLRLRLYCLLF
jgi:hypothetical protein